MLLLMGGSLLWFSGGGDACKMCSVDCGVVVGWGFASAEACEWTWHY